MFRKRGKHRMGSPPPPRPIKWCCGLPSDKPGHYTFCSFTRNQTLISFQNSQGQVLSQVNGLGEFQNG